MAADEMPMDDKAKRMRDLLSSFYAPDPSSSSSTPSKFPSLDAINSPSFDPDQYMNLLAHKSNLEGLLQKHVEMAAEIKNLDTDLQMLVYENYNKFISATDTIKRMKSNIVGMEANMENLLDKILTVQSRSDGVNTSLFEKREHIEKLHQTRNLLRKVQFIYDLPTRLGKCIKTEAYADAVRFYTGAMPIFKAYGDSSFHDCKRASEDAMTTVVKNLQGKLFSDSESIQARAEAAVLLNRLDIPIDNLKAKLFEKMEQSLENLHLNMEELTDVLDAYNDPSKQIDNADIVGATKHDASVRGFAEAVRAYRVIFPESEDQLIKFSLGLISKHFEITKQCIKKGISVENLIGLFGIIWKDVLLMEEVMPEALLPDYSLEASMAVVKQYIPKAFSDILHNISDVLLSINTMKNEVEENPLQIVLEAGKNAVLQGSVDVLLAFRQLLADSSGLLVRLRDLIIDCVQQGFQDFFRVLNDQFFLLSGTNKQGGQDHSSTEGSHVDKVPAGLVLVLAQLSIFVEQAAIPRITEEIVGSFSGGVHGLKNGPAFVSVEICRSFRSAGDKFLRRYINMRTQRVSVLLRKRFATPNWVKHKEPREVHMFVDLFLQELEATGTEVKQILPQGPMRKHRRSESNGSTTSSRSNPLRDDRITRSNTQRARSQLLESHLAKLFKQKVEIFTKVEYTQESILSTVLKLCLKSLLEFVRLHTFNRSGFQQIQLDIQFLRGSLKDTVDDEAAVDFLLDEVIVGVTERCLDPIPLEPPILEKLIEAKLAKIKAQSPTSS